MSQTMLGQPNNRRLSRSNSTSSSVVTVKKSDQQYLRPGNRNSYIARPTTSDATIPQFVANGNVGSDLHFNQTDNSSSASGMNVHRWSLSSSSTAPGIDQELTRPMTNGSSTARNVRRDRSPAGVLIPKSQYSATKQHDRSKSGSSPKKPNSGRPVRRSSPAPPAKPFYNNLDSQASSSGTSLSHSIGQASSKDDEEYYREAWGHRTGSNKYGQPVEAVALQYTTGALRPQKSADRFGSQTSLQSASAQHISLQKRPSHKSYRDRSVNGSKDTAGSSISSTKSEKSRGRGQRSPMQKSMLSKALNKANVAVQLDNAQNIQGAIEAYIEACDLLQEVMVRNDDMEDKKKLSAIRATYSNRIAELHDLDDTFNHLMEKELPEYPAPHESEDLEELYPHDPQVHTDPAESQHVTIPLRQESLLPQIFGGDAYVQHAPASIHIEKSSSSSNLRPPMDVQYMPPPLSPRRPPSPPQEEDITPIATMQPPNAIPRSFDTHASSESTSWLDTFDESASSPNSSRISSFDFGPRDGQLVSEIEAEFDALNRAVDSAYDDEVPQEGTPKPSEQSVADADTSLASPIHDLVTVPHSQTLPQNIPTNNFDFLSGEELDSEAEEEEELLEMMMADGYDLGISKNDHQTKSALPRQSDSSGISGRSSGRGHDSLATSTTTATSVTALSTLAETPEFGLSQASASQVPSKSVVSPAALQSPPRQLTRSARSASVEKHVGLRDRRLSGQSAKQLKIETYNRRPSISKQQQNKLQAPSLEIPHSAPPPELGTTGSASNLSLLGLPLTPMASISGDSAPSESPATPALHAGDLQSSFDHSIPLPQSPGKLTRMMPPPPRKNMSSSSLKPRNLSVTTTEINSETPTTPGSSGFPDARRTGSISTPAVPAVSPNVLMSVATGGMYLFDHIASPTMTMSHTPRSPPASTEPLPLEPCPESYLLRPFWVMRCLYQVLAHPKGGYLTSKLFIPRDIWRVKNVKLKAIDDKIAQCDLLTAALLKLAKVDTLDADAVLEELQSFELILDQTRQSLQKKLGNDVGLAGSATVFKNSPAGDEPETLSAKSSNKPGSRGLASSWRKLRSKSSTAALTPTHLHKEVSSGLTMPSLPMTDSGNVATSRSYRNQRHPPPTPSAMPYIPAQHASYMASLARLFDSVQVLDAIARQVEDPGLKATNQTQVGLEFSIRNAAEFFAFYVVRFALADIGLLVDKFVKRGSEWVMN